MNLERLRQLCKSFPNATEQIQWGNDLVFKVGGKMFCVACSEPASVPIVASFKCEPATFAELTEWEGIVPAPYLARAMWVGLERYDSLDDGEWRELVTRSYEMVSAKLPKKRAATTSAKHRKSQVSSRRKAKAPTAVRVSRAKK
jgi:predicted DNA-binding protein (MmcQ/YjbR family)